MKYRGCDDAQIIRFLLWSKTEKIVINLSVYIAIPADIKNTSTNESRKSVKIVLKNYSESKLVRVTEKFTFI
uniref:MSP domain-containing protein n=1 Tax=Elaeophora elaphi TaxID=1147741 RepID=A0A0R3RQB1_9BILA